MKKLLSLVCLASSCLYGAQIKRIEYRTPQGEQALEVGVLELYFSQAPVFETHRITSGEGNHMVEIQLIDVNIQPTESEKLRQVQGSGYSVSISKKDTASVITISYDPAQISVVCSPLVSIQLEHGIVIRFFNTSLLGKISMQERPILSVACLI